MVTQKGLELRGQRTHRLQARAGGGSSMSSLASSRCRNSMRCAQVTRSPANRPRWLLPPLQLHLQPDSALEKSRWKQGWRWQQRWREKQSYLGWCLSLSPAVLVYSLRERQSVETVKQLGYLPAY